VTDAADASTEDAADAADATVECDAEAYGASSAKHIAGRCAYFFNTAVIWTEADAACRSKGLRLIAVASDAETNEIVAWISTQQNATWVGLNDQAEEGTFAWILADGGGSSEPAYRPEVTENGPDNDCCVLHTIPAQWAALTCDNHFRAYTCTPP